MSNLPVTVSRIPTIATLYARGELLASKSSSFQPHKASLNDRISIYQGDITRLQLDAIVNAANSVMLGGGGIDGAIHNAAGPLLRKECATHPTGPRGRCPTGEARITSGHDLPAKYVIHAVGPNCNKNKDMELSKEQLTAVYDNILNTAAENGVATIGICGISTAIFAYPPRDACMVACDRVRRFLSSKKGDRLERVVFVTFSEKDVDAYDTVLPRWFPPADEETDSEA